MKIDIRETLIQCSENMMLSPLCTIQYLILTFEKWGRGQEGNMMVSLVYLFHSIYEAYLEHSYELGAKRIPKDKSLVLVLMKLVKLFYGASHLITSSRNL